LLLDRQLVSINSNIVFKSGIVNVIPVSAIAITPRDIDGNCQTEWINQRQKTIFQQNPTQKDNQCLSRIGEP
jgi:hypothetical protein